MVLTSCVLHNICEEHGDHFNAELSDEHTCTHKQPVAQVVPERGIPDGADIRAALIDDFNREDECYVSCISARSSVTCVTFTTSPQ